VVLLSAAPLLLLAKKAVPAKDLKEFIAWLKANPNTATAGTAGVGSLVNVVGGPSVRAN
jgi:tripartite-type tricarboxylate transporter receptor subunit TctC